MDIGTHCLSFTISQSWKSILSSFVCFCKRIVFLAVPHLLAVAVLVGYLLLGSYVFCTIEGWDVDKTVMIKRVSNISSLNDTADMLYSTSDIVKRMKRGLAEDSVEKTRKRMHNRVLGWNMFDGVLFAYSTVTTIGYNDLTPTSDGGRLFYILYAMVGVPICTVVLVDWALFVEEFVRYLVRSTALGRRLLRYDTNRHSAIGAEMIIMLPLAITVFLLYIFLGALLLRLWECGWTFADGFYAAFDAVTTIGIGDIRPANRHYYPLTLVYVTVGVAISSTCLSLIVADLAKVIHYAGRKARDCGLKTVYFGSKRVHIRQLLDMVASEWGV